MYMAVMMRGKTKRSTETGSPWKGRDQKADNEFTFEHTWFETTKGYPCGGAQTGSLG